MLKFGGSALASPDQIEAAAHRVEGHLRAGVIPVVVVSAARGTTDDLLRQARRVHGDPPNDELDRLLATGELQAASLVALAIARRGHRTRSLSGAEAGIITDETFGRARILEVNSARLTALLAAGEVPVVTGFQGATRDGRVTTLGRGGSDITAVALAHALGAERAIFHRDVDGIHSADPKLLAASHRYGRLDYEALVDLAEAGVPLVHPQAVQLARAHRICLEMRGSKVGSGATWIGADAPTPAHPVWCVSLSHPMSMLTVDGLPRDLSMLAQLVSMIERSDLPAEGQLGPGPSGGSRVCFSLLLPDDEGPRVRDVVGDFLREESGIRTTLERQRRRVTLVGRGVGSRRVSKAVEEVSQRFGSPMATLWGPHHRAFVVPDGDGRQWLATLHQELIAS